MSHAHDMVAMHVANKFSNFSSRRSYSEDLKDKVLKYCKTIMAGPRGYVKDEYDIILEKWAPAAKAAFQSYWGVPLSYPIPRHKICSSSDYKLACSIIDNNAVYYNKSCKGAFEAASNQFGVTVSTISRWWYNA